MSQLKLGFSGREATLQDFQQCVGAGWSDIIRRLVDDLWVLGWDGVALQIKEKFGALRIYLGDGQTEEMRQRVYVAENESYKTCEECGQPGEVRTGGWLKTLCEAHANGRPVDDDGEDD